MKDRRTAIGRLIAVTGLLVLVSAAAPASHDVYLQGPNTIPSYCQEVGNWCGAATAQMILESYPPPYNEHPYPQSVVWDTIQIYKDDPGVNWATDPDGLRDTLMDLGYEPGVYWSISAVPDKYDQTFAATYWMTAREFPVATLVWGWAHWVAVIGFTTDVDPTQNPDITLEWIEIINPWNPPCPTASYGGEQVLMTGDEWLTSYWNYPGNYPASKWDGNFIAIIEPPPASGRATEPEEGEKMSGGVILTPEQAIEMAHYWIQVYGLDARDPYSALADLDPLTPQLVTEPSDGYYIVPFGKVDAGKELAYCGVTIDDETGKFGEVGYFNGNAIEYLTEDEALAVARGSERTQSTSQPAAATLGFWPSNQLESRFKPAWRFVMTSESEMEDRVAQVDIYVTQEREVYDQLTPWPLGD